MLGFFEFVVGYFSHFFDHIWCFWPRNIDIHIQKVNFASTKNSGSPFLGFKLQLFISIFPNFRPAFRIINVFPRIPTTTEISNVPFFWNINVFRYYFTFFWKFRPPRFFPNFFFNFLSLLKFYIKSPSLFSASPWSYLSALPSAERVGDPWAQGNFV